uniref:Uncharacterized protein n=1 Tax=Tanacetum cinerariifolium TaxID=118510 RepID=A0A699L5W8_TANCI|nr:hypothetical protein [Tanacetum cinerariifolium]
MKDQPLPADASPITLLPGDVVDSDPEKEENDPKEDPAYYPADRRDNDDDESSNDDDDDDDDSKQDPPWGPFHPSLDRSQQHSSVIGLWVRRQQVEVDPPLVPLAPH